MAGTIEKYTTKRGTRYRAAIKMTLRNGAKQRVSKSFATKAEADAWLAAQTTYRNEGGRLAKGSLGAYLKAWLAERERAGNIRPNTLSSYRSKMHTATRSIGHVQLSALDADHVSQWLADLADAGQAKATIVQSRNIMHKALRDAVRRRLIPFNPVDGVEAPKAATKERPMVLSLADAERFLAAMDETEFAGMFRLMAYTGMRRSEAGGLRWSDIDLEARRITVNQTLICESHPGRQEWVFSAPKSKTSKRKIAIPVKAVDMLRRHKAQIAQERLAAGERYADLDLVFCDYLGRPLKLDTVSARARRIREKLGLPDGVQAVHGLRHLYGTQLNAAGVDPKTIQASMGHSRVTTTFDLYVHTDDDQLDEAADKIGALFN